MNTHPGLTDGPIYLDYNATTPTDPRVVDAMLPYLTTHFGNPSSGHTYRTAPADAIARARAQVARLIGAQPAEIVFTGSGSEANNLAISGTILAGTRTDGRPAHVVTQTTEHPAVLAMCDALRRLDGVEVTYLTVDAEGRVDPRELAAAITDHTVLVSIMLANNETGTLQPVTELAGIAHEHGVLFHTDAAQAVGKIPVNVTELGVDLLTLVGHKMYAPKGVAALYVGPGPPRDPLIHAGGQEHGLPARTENVALIVALGAAADLAAADLHAGEPDRLRHLRDDLHHRLAEQLPGQVLLNGHPTHRLPNTANLALLPHRGDDILAATPDIAASTGSACHTSDTRPSPVLTAMALPGEQTRSAVRLSLGRWTTPDNIALAATQLIAATGRRRGTHVDAGQTR
ncbi:cysteine desulfurase [Micromonospora sp. CPCC 205371]|nr:cysteine desulfurase [Micromonospora sp. CPCC 205371]